MWIGDQFAKNKAEQLGLIDIANIFSPTPETTILERPTNHLILGAKGSGKSTLLRALTLPVWKIRQSTYPPQFIGIYLPIRYEDATYFRTAYDELQSTVLFEHFFVVLLLSQVAIQLKEAKFSEDSIFNIIIEHISSSKRNTFKNLLDLTLRLIKEKDFCISLAKNKPNIDYKGIDFISGEPFNISKIQYLAEQVITSIGQSDGYNIKRFGILIDSLDYYGSLSTIIAPLFESDSSNPIVIKAAARSIDVSQFAERSRSRQLEPQRDFEIVTLDREPDDLEHLKLLKEAICKRARYNAPSEITNLTNDQILSILFDGSTDDSEDEASFSSFSRLSSGNVLQLILLIDESSTIYKSSKTIPIGVIEPISRNSRLKAIEQESRKFWDLEIGVRLSSKKLEAKVYCELLVETAKNTSKVETLLAPQFKFEYIPTDCQNLLSSLLSTRVLIANDSIVHKTLQAGFPYSGEITLELNRLMLNKIGLRPMRGAVIEIDTKKFHKNFIKNLQETKPYLSPKATISKGELFNPDFLVFISLPFDQQKKSRTTILRKSINAIYKDTTGKDGKAGMSYIDIHYIPHVGSFRFEIPNYINESTYFVADISEIGVHPSSTSGIFYEIGLSIGKKKPLALFYNSKDLNFGIPSFNSNFLPKLLTGQTVIIVDSKTQNFLNIFKPIHEKLIAYNGFLENPFGISSHSSIDYQHPYAYLSFQPRNNLAYEWFKDTFKNIFPELTILKAPQWEADEGPSLYSTIKNSSFCIIDCTEGINNYSIELGICSALNLQKVLEVWDSNIEKRPNPISMYPGKRFAWTDMLNNDSRQLIELIKHLARTTILGTQRI